ncbi:cobalt-precorrin-4 C(11)-methyltransferase [Bacillus sp. OxB-1]|uniref:precorrin-4 C(11)-methyltransferase n=1 Tax=Bacillus sp. (strain OxB-1) TaxID=98228 RepID=UPI000581B9E9|nr:precorrin-4 C(11)-methyltransferase [Bacillus sp. OxB-1]BAQ09697.1 cobalt-precorrin-4 C(11)-methyltransferase [Bacillus sp. OxB-1]
MNIEAKVYFIGAGPGDPELITVKGLKLLQTADVVLFTDSLVNEKLMDETKEGALVLKSAGMALEEQIDIMAGAVEEGKSVARIHTGDPAIYGAILEQMSRLYHRGISYEVIPGVSSVFASAARAGVELTVPELTQTVILTRAEGRTPVPEKEQLVDLARHHCTVSLFLSATLIKKVVKSFYEAGWAEDAPVLVVYKATWPDELILRTTLDKVGEDMRANRITKQAMVIISPAVDPKLVEQGGYESKLYDKTFTHGFRKGVTADG